MLSAKMWLALLAASLSPFVLFSEVEAPSVGVPGASAASSVLAADGAIAMNGSAPLDVPVALRLTGNVTGLPISVPLESVSVQVGARIFPATVNAQDRSWSVEIPWSSPLSMVTVTSTAQRAVYRSAVGSLGRLKRLSGGDGVASAVDAPMLSVSPITTALTVLHQAMYGEGAASDVDLERALRYMGGYALALPAYIFEAYASGERSLPSGVRSALEGVSTQDAYGPALTPDT